MDRLDPYYKPSDLIRVLPDHTAIISGSFFLWVKQQFNQNSIVHLEILLLRAIIDEIEYQANLGHSVGFVGLNELKKLRELEDNQQHYIQTTVHREPSHSLSLRILENRLPPNMRGSNTLTALDQLVRQITIETDSILFTINPIQTDLGAFEHVPLISFPSTPRSPHSSKVPKLEDFFTDGVMSVHLIENCLPRAKRGRPGSWRLESQSDTILNRMDLDLLIADLIGRAKSDSDKSIEIERRGATVIQFADMRVVITQPPFSKYIEITATRPIVQLTLADYNLSKQLNKRLRNHADGILIAGAPGSGKTSFAAALADYFSSFELIVKTMEQPRDLRVPPTITQYAALDGDLALTADILLLVRPDVCIFDEMRKTDDFKVYADMRLAGVGMIGICHATRPIDAIQRFLGRVELGMIPQIIDTVIFIQAGQINTVLDITLTVKVPTGIASADLARPVLEIRDFQNNALLFEIYPFGEQIVTVPISAKKNGADGAYDNTKHSLLRIIAHVIDTSRLQVEMLGPKRARILAPSADIRRLIGKGGKVIRKLEKRTGLKLDVEELTPKHTYTPQKEPLSPYSGYPIKSAATDRHIVLYLGKEEEGRRVHILNAEQQSLLEVTVGRGGEIKIRLDSDIGQTLLKTIERGEQLFAHNEIDSH